MGEGVERAQVVVEAEEEGDPVGGGVLKLGADRLIGEQRVVDPDGARRQAEDDDLPVDHDGFGQRSAVDDLLVADGWELAQKGERLGEIEGWDSVQAAAGRVLGHEVTSSVRFMSPAYTWSVTPLCQ